MPIGEVSISLQLIALESPKTALFVRLDLSLA